MQLHVYFTLQVHFDGVRLQLHVYFTLQAHFDGVRLYYQSPSDQSPAVINHPVIKRPRNVVVNIRNWNISDLRHKKDFS